MTKDKAIQGAQRKSKILNEIYLVYQDSDMDNKENNYFDCSLSYYDSAEGQAFISENDVIFTTE